MTDINHRRKNKSANSKAIAGRTAKPNAIEKYTRKWGRVSHLADVSIEANISKAFNKSQRGIENAVRSAKKMVRARFRFHEKAATRNLVTSAE